MRMTSDQFYLNISTQAFRKDEIVDPLSDPGNIDITSDIDFEELSVRGMQVPHGKIDL